MRGKKELKKAQFKTFSNCFDVNPNYAGKWSKVFGNQNPITLELGCGRGEFGVEFAKRFPNQNVIGMDIRAPRMWAGAKLAIQDKVPNILFIKENASALAAIFAPNEISKIWLTFPDPYPKDRHAKRRMTNHSFIEIYRKILAPNGIFNLKTDSDSMYEFTLEMLKSLHITHLLYTTNLHNSPYLNEETGILTQYERIFLAENKSINYLQFKINS